MERALILCDAERLDAGDFSIGTSTGAAADSLNLELQERRNIEAALERFGGNISHAASALGITRAALYRRIEKHSL